VNTNTCSACDINTNSCSRSKKEPLKMQLDLKKKNVKKPKKNLRQSLKRSLMPLFQEWTQNRSARTKKKDLSTRRLSNSTRCRTFNPLSKMTRT
jgi:hypothetical protein